MVIFGVPEEEDRQKTEDCDSLITKILVSKNVFSPGNDGSVFDRAHRLGQRKQDQARPRPIIDKVTFYKDKVHILQNAHKLRGTNVNISEDFSRATLDIRRQLVTKAKTAKDKCSSMKHFKVQYKRLIVTYENPDTGRLFYRGFNLSDIVDNPYWYLPNSRNITNNGNSASA